MKTVKQILASIVLFSFALFSCKDKLNIEIDPANGVELTLSQSHLKLSVDQTKNVKIVTGNGNYRIIKIETPDVLTAVIGKDNKSIDVTAKKEGTTKITITDDKNQTVDLEIQVVKGHIYVKHSKFSLAKGMAFSVKVENSENYTFKSDTKNVELTNDDETKTLTIKGVSLGQSVITLTDKETEATTTITVDVKDNIDLRISKEDFIDIEGTRLVDGKPKNVGTPYKSKGIRLHRAKKENQHDMTYRQKALKILSGSGVYDVEKVGSMLSGSVKDDVLTIKTETDSQRVLGIETIKITDKITGQYVEIDVHIVEPLDVKSEDIIVRLNQKSEERVFVIVSRGSAKHVKLKIEDAEIAKVEDVIRNDVKDRGFVVLGKKLGVTKLTINDGVRVIEVPVKVIKDVLDVTLISEDIKLQQNAKVQAKVNKEISFKIQGSGEYEQVYTPESAIADKKLENGTLTLTTGAKAQEVIVKITDKKTGEFIDFTITITEGEVYNCDPMGEFKVTIDYGNTKHDSKKVPVVCEISGKREKTYDCAETITMKVGDVVKFKMCGGFNNDHSLDIAAATDYSLRHKIVKLSKKESTITAIQKGVLVVYTRGYKKEGGYSVPPIYTYYKIVVE